MDVTALICTPTTTYAALRIRAMFTTNFTCNAFCSTAQLCLCKSAPYNRRTCRLLRNDTKLGTPAAPGVWQKHGKLRNVCRDVDTQHEASSQL